MHCLELVGIRSSYDYPFSCRMGGFSLIQIWKIMSHTSLLLFLQKILIFFFREYQARISFPCKKHKQTNIVLLDMTIYRKEEKYRSVKKHRKAQFYRFFYKDQGELLLSLFQYYSLEFAEACRGQFDFLKACQNCLTQGSGAL